MSIFIKEINQPGSIRVVIKDNIDLKGYVTTAGSKALESIAEPAQKSAFLLKNVIKNDIAIVGKANMNELALGVTGINPFYGTPVNPINSQLIPGGSSSGCAVAIKLGIADIAFGTDTGGSIRIPATCCGIVGLKTTYSRISLEGIYPLAPSLDTVGSLCKDIDNTVRAMELLEPGFKLKPVSCSKVAFFSADALPSIKQIVMDSIGLAGITLEEIQIDQWEKASEVCLTIMHYEAWNVNKMLIQRCPDLISQEVLTRLLKGKAVTKDDLTEAYLIAESFKDQMKSIFEKFNFLITPTLAIYPPKLSDANMIAHPSKRLTLPFNLVGLPALSTPAVNNPLVGIQIAGPWFSEPELLFLGKVIEDKLINGA